MKSYSLAQMKDKYIGRKGTVGRANSATIDTVLKSIQSLES
jgi:hypothetical protein